MTSKDSLSGNHALVTGGTRGIGLAIAQSLLERGAKVTIAARKATELKKAGALLSQLGDVNCLQLDVTDSIAVPTAIKSATNQFGVISILINNAGQYQIASLNKTNLALFNSMLAINLTSAFVCTQAVLPAMLKLGWGRIVNIASIDGLRGSADTSAYCAAKHGMVGLTRSIALEVAKKGITVNAICPGYTETESVHSDIMNAVKKSGRTIEQVCAEFAENKPLGRLVQMKEVAHAVAWLCMPGASAINGQAILVDGGELF